MIGRISSSIRHRLRSRLVRTLARRSAIISCDPPIASFTFDDAPCSAGEAGARLLETHDVRGTFYLAGSLLGTGGAGEAMLDGADVRDLAARGHEIGCHTHAHARPAGRGRATISADLDRNASALEGLVPGLRLRSFAYPFGEVTLPLKRAAGSRFDTCRIVRGGVNAGRVDLALLRAAPLYGRKPDQARIDELVARAERANGWLIFYTHEVRPEPGTHGCTSRHLGYALDRVLTAGFRVLPVRDALIRARAGA